MSFSVDCTNRSYILNSGVSNSHKGIAPHHSPVIGNPATLPFTTENYLISSPITELPTNQPMEANVSLIQQQYPNQGRSREPSTTQNPQTPTTGRKRKRFDMLSPQEVLLKEQVDLVRKQTELMRSRNEIEKARNDYLSFLPALTNTIEKLVHRVDILIGNSSQNDED